MIDRRLNAPTVRAARELAAVCAQIRQAHPSFPWRVPDAEDRAPPTEQQESRLDRIIELYRDGYEYKQIADELGISHPTVNTIIRDARRAGAWPAELRRSTGGKRAAHHD